MFSNAAQLRATTPSPLYTGEFNQFSGRPDNFKQTLWTVQDKHIDFPEDRFVGENSALVEAVIETNVGPIEQAPIPQGLLDFVTRFVEMFHVIPTEFSSVSDVIHFAKPFFDYIEPYFLFVDMPVQIAGNQLVQTYRHKDGGSVLDPTRVEVFKVIENWEFESFDNVALFLKDPKTLAVLGGQKIENRSTGEPVTREDLLDRIVQTIWGTPKHLLVHVEDWLYRHYSDLEHTPRFQNDDDLMRSLESYQRQDLLFWKTAATAIFLWFRSPHSLPFLIHFHPIYEAVLRINSKSGNFEIVPGSGGEAVVYKWEVYSHQHLIVEANRPPGTCECCQNSLHCTKFINATALFHPKCSCGNMVDVEDVGEERYRHGYSSKCEPYQKEHPAFEAFACQRCLQMAILDPHNQERKCERFECPATSCPHHAGQQAYVQALAQRRRLMLTEMRH